MMQLVIDSNGIVTAIYSEDIDLASLGALAITRASHVEPDASGHWWADLSPTGGPRLGLFKRRSEALAAETRWIEKNLLARSRASNPDGCRTTYRNGMPAGRRAGDC